MSGKKICYCTLGIVFMFAFTVNNCISADTDKGGKVLSNSFATDPNLKVTKGEDTQHKTDSIEAAVPLPSTAGKGFIMEFDIDITKFNHYGILWAGLNNSANKQRIYCWFQRPDDRIARCHFECSLGPGLQFEGKPFENMEAGKYHYKMEYQAIKKYARWTVFNKEGEQIYDSGAVKLGGRFEVNEFWFKVIDKKDSGISDISYEPDTQNIFFRSYIGNEGDYPYSFEGYVDNLTVRYLPE